MVEFSEERSGRVTASRAIDYMAKGRGRDELFGKTCHSYAKELALARLGFIPEPVTTWAMEHGLEWEGPALEVYANSRPNNKVTNGYFITQGDNIGCTPDSFVDDDGLVEVKCLQWDNHTQYLMDGPPKQYIYQMQFQMWVTEREWCDFLLFHPHMPTGLQAKVFRIERDEALINSFMERLDPFVAIVDSYVEKLNGETT